MDIGRKIYYEKTSGIVIWDKGEMSGAVVETTFEEDCQVMPILPTVTTDQLGVLQLEYGANAQDFATCRGYKIDPVTQAVIFIN